MIDADTQMRQAAETAHYWTNELIDKPKDWGRDSEMLLAAQIIAAGLDEIAMSNRMLAEVIRDRDCCCRKDICEN